MMCFELWEGKTNMADISWSLHTVLYSVDLLEDKKKLLENLIKRKQRTPINKCSEQFTPCTTGQNVRSVLNRRVIRW